MGLGHILTLASCFEEMSSRDSEWRQEPPFPAGAFDNLNLCQLLKAKQFHLKTTMAKMRPFPRHLKFNPYLNQICNTQGLNQFIFIFLFSFFIQGVRQDSQGLYQDHWCTWKYCVVWFSCKCCKFCLNGKDFFKMKILLTCTFSFPLIFSE